MHKSFDSILASRISEVFQNHQEPYRPADLEKLRAKISKVDKPKVIWFSFIAKAASIAILIGFSVFSLNDLKTNSIDNKMVGVNLNNTDSTINILESKALSSTEHQKQTINITDNKKSKQIPVLNNEEKIEILKNDEISLLRTDSTTKPDSIESRFAHAKKELDVQMEEINKMKKNKPDTNQIKPINDYPEFEFVEKKNEQNNFDFGVEVASVSNYAVEGEGSSLNVGGGFSTSWNFSEKMSLSTGMIIARQSINCYQNQSDGLVYSDLAYNNALYASTNSLKSVDMNSADSKVEFIGIDIPLNIQLKFAKIVLTTGISSLLYVQEKFSYTYSATVTNTAYDSESKRYEIQNTMSQVVEQQQTKSFDRFDFARLINVAVGYKLPLNKGDIMLEPYLKLPVGNISSYNIKMGSGGLAFRYIF